MVHGVNDGGGGLARAAIEAALERHAEGLQKLQESSGELAGSESTSEKGPAFSSLLSEGISGVDAQVRSADQLPFEMLEGKLDFHEVAARLKQSELALSFALEVRNKFVDAYREVMRMSV